MRIISGTAGGHTLKVPPMVTRPTSDRVREALFSMLLPRLEGARVLDLFAGSGSCGLESLSRGANEAIFVEENSAACAVIQENLIKTKLTVGKIIKGDVFTTLRRLAEMGSCYDIIFADPPYAKNKEATDFASQLLHNADLQRVLAPEGWFVLESMVTKQASEVIASWDTVRDRAYGSTRIHILQSSTTDNGANFSAADLQPALSADPAGHDTCSAAKDEGSRRKMV